MKKLLPFFYLALTMLAFDACTNKEVNVQEDKPAESKVNLDSLIRRSIYHVASAYTVKGNDTVDLAKNGIYAGVSKTIYLEFAESGLFWYSGNPVNSDTLPAGSQAFNVLYKIRRDSNLKFGWDEARQTFVVKSVGTSSYFQFIPDGREATLVQEESVLYGTYQEARNAPPGKLTFKYVDPAPASGPVTYTIVLKPMWFLADDPNSLSNWYYVAF
jgi:hypothetical protein